jgi:hypothetical protein
MMKQSANMHVYGKLIQWSHSSFKRYGIISAIIALLGFDNSLQTPRVEHGLWGFCNYGWFCESLKSTFVVDLQHATHTVVFANLLINGRNEGVHGFVCQLRDAQGYTCPGIRIADNGQKVGVNGVDNGRIW